MNYCSNTNNDKSSLSDRQTPRHQGKRGISLRFEVFAGFSTSKSSRFWISVQFFGRPFESPGSMKRAYFAFIASSSKLSSLPRITLHR